MVIPFSNENDFFAMAGGFLWAGGPRKDRWEKITIKFIYSQRIKMDTEKGDMMVLLIVKIL